MSERDQRYFPVKLDDTQGEKLLKYGVLDIRCLIVYPFGSGSSALYAAQMANQDPSTVQSFSYFELRAHRPES